jgi:hypothetical protein
MIETGKRGAISIEDLLGGLFGEVNLLNAEC